MKNALAFVLGGAGMEFMCTIRYWLLELFGISLNDTATGLLGVALGLLLTLVFVVLPEVKKNA